MLVLLIGGADGSRRFARSLRIGRRRVSLIIRIVKTAFVLKHHVVRSAVV
jgi:predicted metallo-beta-lactamase superfamily hydrolase